MTDVFDAIAAPDALPARLRKPRLTRNEAAEYLLLAHGASYTAPTLAKYATVGGGPRYFKLGARVLYERADLDRWIADRLRPRASTSDNEGGR